MNPHREPKALHCAGRLGLAAIAVFPLIVASASSAEVDRARAAPAFGKARPVLAAQPDGLLICEAEEFQVQQPGWRAGRWGENYYAATFANSFLSRKAFLGAPEQCDETVASLKVDVPSAGAYLALVRYEAAYRFETQFRVRIEQNGRQVFDRLYGARDNLKIWAFREKLKKEVGWSWGAVENIVWEGHDASVDLQAGPATISLIAGRQPEPGARRNVDLVMLTTDNQQVATRIETENYLPLDGMLTQSGDVWLKVHNLGKQPLTFQGRGATGGGNWQQHSPYWVHIRNWPTPSVQVAPGQASEWVEVGGTMDSLNDGQWFWTGDGSYRAEFAVRGPTGKLEPLATFSGQGDLSLAGDADTRYTRRLRKLEDVLYDLLNYLKQQPVHGRAPTRTPIYASTFDALDDGKHAAAVAEFKSLFGLSDGKPDSGPGRGYIDVRGVATGNLREYCEKLGEAARRNIAVVSLGDEISLPSPSGAAAQEAFRQWLMQQGLKPAEIDPAAGNDWTKIAYNPAPALKASNPGIYYWSKRYQYHFGIQEIKQRTDILRRHLPNAGIGANYSPHYPQEHMFLGEVFKWVSVFRQDGMTLPWSEDYIWQVPVGTPQMNNINLDLFRAGLRHHPDRKIHYYVMPHMPNNTPDQWRRLFYGCLGHGMKMVNLFEFRPVHVAYTENHVDEPEMYAAVLRGFRELGLFEDVVQDGQVQPAQAALWFSETGDIWGDSHGSFAAGKRALYTAIRQQQIPLDFVVEQDAVDGTLNQYKVLYLTDAHVSTVASRKIQQWVEAGGVLMVTAGGGMFDEHNRPNTVLRELLGVQQQSIDAPEMSQIIWIKQDLPFAEPIDGLKQADGKSPDELPVFCVRSRVQLTTATSQWQFRDGSPGVTTRTAGQGQAIYCGFLPALSYYKPAIPLRPVDRGATDDAMVHFLPTEFDSRAAALIASPAAGLKLPIQCSQPLVETTVLRSSPAVVIPLVNWTPQPVKDLRLTVRISAPKAHVSLASGRPVTVTTDGDATIYMFDLDVADALILR